MNKAILTVASTALLLSLTTACSKPSSTASSAPEGGPPPSMGTVSSGGGGNGIDNKAIESYAVRIEELAEYKRYITPVLRRISRGRGDVLAAYMNYVIQNKPWYLIPRDLDDVPKDRVGLGFKTEQLALHSDSAVYLHKASYLKKNQRERADLLMHEIVMGARLLMKKSPTEQCEKLAGNDLKACQDPQMMKLAEAQNFDAKEQIIMNETDHDAVRALTVFLMQRSEEITASSVFAKRRQLKFLFPWDQAVSQVTPDDVVDMLQRGNLADKVYRPTTAYSPQMNPAVDVRCRWNKLEYQSLYIALFESAPGFMPGDYHQTDPSKRPILPADQTVAGGGPYKIDWAGEVQSHITYRSAYAWTSGSTFTARGVVNPSNPKEIVDLVTIQPELQLSEAMDVLNPASKTVRVLNQMELLISRKREPQILEFRVRPVRLLSKGAPKSMRDIQMVPQDKYNLRCKLEESGEFNLREKGT